MRIFLTTVLFIICFSNFTFSQRKSKGNASEQLYNPKFQFDPNLRNNTSNSGITIAVLRPFFGDREYERFGIPWSDFTKSMASDLEELLISKGFRVRGPFTSKDEMVYNDKLNSDFTLEFKIDFDIVYRRTFKNKGGLSLLSTVPQRRVEKGEVSINTKLIITAISNFSGEKLWKKNLELPQKNITYSGSINWEWNSEPSFLTEMKQDLNLWNPVCKELEFIYEETFKILSNQFEINEMKLVQGEAIKERPKN